MADARPDPDELLVRIKADEARARRGRLRIFFGATAGVGKTYAMLEAARGAHAAGTEIVLGYIEPHGRVETERLMEGLEKLPTLPVSYGGIVRQEFDLDAALKRKSAILGLVTPTLHVRSRRRALENPLDNFRRKELMVAQTRQRIRARMIAVPTVFGTRFVVNFAAVIRVLRRLQKIFDEVDGVVEIVVISLPDVDV